MNPTGVSTEVAAAEWQGEHRRHDSVKEAVVAFAVLGVLSVALALLFSSPDVPAVSLQRWAKADPADFLKTAASELDGTSATARYGPPYNHGHGSVQRLAVSWQQLAGVEEPLDPAVEFVIYPLSRQIGVDPALAHAFAIYQAAPRSRRLAWAGAYHAALAGLRFVAGRPVVPRGDYGPVPTLLGTELSIARAGGLDIDLLNRSAFYGTNYTRPLLFLADGSYFGSVARTEHMVGNQWGVMSETGSYPGQPWLWLYTLWYQVPPFSHSGNVDLIAIYLTGLATLLLLLVPFVPGLRDLPRLIPVHRLIWRSYYRDVEQDRTPPG